jgi:hypothetical protein
MPGFVTAPMVSESFKRSHCPLPTAHVLCNYGSDLAAEIREAHVAHAFGFEDGIGERIHVGRR